MAHIRDSAGSVTGGGLDPALAPEAQERGATKGPSGLAQPHPWSP
jgi:hypothetical protein